MTDFLKLINPFNLLSFLYEQFTPVHHYEFKNRNVDYFSEEEHGEIEVEIKKSLFVRDYALKVPYGCVISSDQNLMFSRKFDVKTEEDYVLIPQDQIPKQLQISKLKLRYSCKSNKKSILEPIFVRFKTKTPSSKAYTL